MLVMGTINVGVVVFKEGGIRALCNIIVWFDFFLHINRFNIEQEIIVKIIDSNHNVLDLTSNFIFSGNTNFSPSTFIVLGRNIVDFKTNVLKDKTYPLNSLLFQVEGLPGVFHHFNRTYD